MASTVLPQIGDIVHYSGDGTQEPWVERREEKIPYVVIDTAYDAPHGSVLCMLKGNNEPTGKWPSLNEWFAADPRSVTIIQRARYSEPGCACPDAGVLIQSTCGVHDG